MAGSDVFEAWLDRALPAALQSEMGPSPRAVQAAYRSGRAPDPQWAVVGILVRGVALGAAAALVIGAGWAAMARATGTVDPVTWGQAVMAVVEGCTDSLHGQDRCQSSPGTQTRTDRPAPQSTLPGAGGSPPAGTPAATPPGARTVPAPAGSSGVAPRAAVGSVPSGAPDPADARGGHGHGRGGGSPPTPVSTPVTAPTPIGGGGAHKPVTSPPPTGGEATPTPAPPPTPSLSPEPLP